jgi:hypothetical protein
VDPPLADDPFVRQAAADEASSRPRVGKINKIALRAAGVGRPSSGSLRLIRASAAA